VESVATEVLKAAALGTVETVKMKTRIVRLMLLATKALWSKAAQ
jgi:hypothetical protein